MTFAGSGVHRVALGGSIRTPGERFWVKANSGATAAGEIGS